MPQLTWSLLTGTLAHTHTKDDPRDVSGGSAHFHDSAPVAHRHPAPGAPAEIYDRLATARWLLQREVKQILEEQGLLAPEVVLPTPRVV